MTVDFRLPGQKMWTGTLFGIGPESDYENYANGGIIKFDDGTWWVCMTETNSTGHFTYGMNFFELTPGAKAWEKLAADAWTDPRYDTFLPPSSGRMIDYQFGYGSDFFIAHDGGDDVYIFDVDGSNEETWFLTVLHRSTRTFSRYPWASADYIPLNNPVIYEDYIYWFNWNIDLCRTRKDDPSQFEVYTTFTHRPFTETPRYTNLNPSTGLPYGLDDDAYDSQHMCFAIHDGWVYTVEGEGYDYSAYPDDYMYQGFRRFKLGTNDVELLHYRFTGVTTHSFRYADEEKFSHDLYEGVVGWIGVGIYPAPFKAEVKDDWLYWIDAASSGTSDGYYFARIYLPGIIKDAPTVHDPYNPKFEILHNATASAEHGGARTGPWQGGEWHIWWREGDRPLCGTHDACWVFDDDGSIVFTHENFLYTSRRSLAFGGYVTRIISRLSPPEVSRANVTLKFTGNELKGYSQARAIPSLTAPEVLELE